jgi:DNA polymerase-1
VTLVVEKVAQNFPFDSVVLAREYGFTFRNLRLDTMLAQHTCYCELPKGLDFLTSIYTRHPYYSDYDVADDLQTWTYNCWDAMVTFEIGGRLIGELENLGVSKYYHSFKHDPMLAFTRAETRGIKIDVVERERRTVEAQAKKTELTIKLRTITNLPNLNPTSDKQLKDYVYGTLHLPPQFHKRTKALTFDKDARRKLREKFPQHGDFFTASDDYSTVDTLLSSFLLQPLGADGRIRTHYNPAGTVSDRLSSSEPIFDPGTNLQNIPRGDFRRMFVSDDGWSLIKADLSQAEWRIVCWIVPVKRIIQRYKDQPDFDVHRWVASLIYKVVEDAVTKDQRSLAKNGVYGGNYKMYYTTAAAVYKLAVSVAKFILDEYRRVVPEIPAWWPRVDAQICQTRVMTNVHGRRHIFFGRIDNDETFRLGYADEPQSTVAGIINRGFSLADDIFDDDECYPLLQVHDEIVFQCRDELVPVYVPKIKRLLEYPLKFPFTDEPLVIPADIGVGKNWHDVKAWDFEKGMVKQ